ncbi:cbb3-type cytochrome oxidase subunit 3 [Pseudidiomarina terrestris]|uniref:Cbb3-type cytochrome c oxidase subunit 3 n=1 Tax=Pseudidiomarina terrestris TaxID=2820060 RepID=A0AAW7QZE5_9GAMM|nr:MULTISPECIES: cbb3-type cytochrome c oxidase subunit 3 [unclassified Pseudidiomarina]MDN7123679.1 cbb3-type cytochrome c oxidase subunit 3 [Pseudidiomarina sp. 1APP75-32.1]MDN7126531.1 cbb3-type cytochrome c oxidase subunit 3 [Pseudidiomarina sp. 1APR75-33.1]MDN7128597.1 cbb3-type cytochrome c oxidase subunit 3 [Pseudidiomarina sp. 1APR75-15]MDN7135144.1 cbb3-type cytochrome c oxidase subunit 3 [Pseudidiomarina sp. 1ASP75-5]MDN7137815.1 cbb3-type cytochrome c oxidase subunit 3 [Pseudidiomar
MDYITWRSFYTVLVFVLFIGVVFWAYSKGRKKKFDEAAKSIFEEDELKETKQDNTKQESKDNE